VAQQGRRASSNAFVVLVAARTQGLEPRLGITASRKVGGAVLRNRVKRRIREWFRRRRDQVPPQLDVLVIVRRAAIELEWRDLDRVLTQLVTRAVAQA